jgi:hypothetical protein
VSANYLYVANGNRMSIKASYTQSERQLKSAGSLLFGGGFAYFDIGSDSAIIPKDHFKKDSIRKEEQFVNGYFLSPAVKVGYAYNLVLFKKLSLLLAVIPGISFEQYNFKNNQDERIKDFKINFQGEARYAFVFSSDKFFCGIDGITELYTHKLKQSDFSYSNSRIETFVGWRLEPFWKKKKSEIPTQPNKF